MITFSYTCNYCKKGFNGHKRKYCTMRCGRLDRVKDNCNCGSKKYKSAKQCRVCKDSQKKVRKCGYCSKPITGRFKHCNRECGNRGRIYGTKAFHAIIVAKNRFLDKLAKSFRKCSSCCKTFKVNGRLRYCHECKRLKRKQQTAKRKENYDYTPVPLVTKDCDCGGLIIGTEKVIARMKHCKKCSTKNKSSRAKHKRRARIKNNNEKVNITDVISSVGLNCKMCGINTIEGSNSNQGTSIDHIIPLAKGGLHSESNLTVLCRLCNSKKCDSIAASDINNKLMFIIKRYTPHPHPVASFS